MSRLLPRSGGAWSGGNAHLVEGDPRNPGSGFAPGPFPMPARIFLLTLALVAPAAPAAVIGGGDRIAIAGGTGVDLVVWRDAATSRLQFLRYDAAGTKLDASPVEIAPAADGSASAAWDGSGFVVAVSGSTPRVVRVPVTGGAAFNVALAASPVAWSTVASRGDGTSLVVWSSGGQPFAGAVEASGSPIAIQPIPLDAHGPAALAWDGRAYRLAWVGPCGAPSACGSGELAFAQSLDARGGLSGRIRAIPAGDRGIRWSLAGGSAPLISWSTDGSPARTDLLDVAAGEANGARRSIRFFDALRAQATARGTALVGGGARIDLTPDLGEAAIGWAPTGDHQRLAGVLPSSGLRVLAPLSGPGPIAIEPLPRGVSEVGLAPVFVSPTTIWLKIDNRGPDAPQMIDLWVTARVRSFNSARLGEITRFGAMTRIRFPTTLHKGAGFEVAMFFEEPPDTSAFEAWVLPVGTDRDGTNNYVSTRAPDSEITPLPPRGRTVRRP